MFGVDPAPVAQNDSGHRTVSAAEFGNRDLAAQVHAVVTMQVGKDRCGLWTEHVQQRQFAALEKSHVNPCIACSGGGLQPDPAGADDGNPMRLGEPSLDAFTVVDAAQVVHAVEVGPWHAEASRCRPGRQQQLVVAQLHIGGGGDGPRSGVE
jgi:hypothetical protein